MCAEKKSEKKDRPRQRKWQSKVDRWKAFGRQIALDRGHDLINDRGVMCPSTDTWHPHGKKIHQCKSSYVVQLKKLWPCQKVTPTPDPRLSFCFNPTSHPAFLTSNPFLSQQHLHSLLALSLSLYPWRFFSLLSLAMSRYLMFLFPLLIPNLHSIQAGGFQWRADVRNDKLWRLCLATQNTVSYLNCSAREDISGSKKKKLKQE